MRRKKPLAPAPTAKRITASGAISPFCIAASLMVKRLRPLEQGFEMADFRVEMRIVAHILDRKSVV